MLLESLASKASIEWGLSSEGLDVDDFEANSFTPEIRIFALARRAILTIRMSGKNLAKNRRFFLSGKIAENGACVVEWGESTHSTKDRHLVAKRLFDLGHRQDLSFAELALRPISECQSTCRFFEAMIAAAFPIFSELELDIFAESFGEYQHPAGVGGHPAGVGGHPAGVGGHPEEWTKEKYEGCSTCLAMPGPMGKRLDPIFTPLIGG